MLRAATLLAVVVLLIASALPSPAAAPRVLPAGQVPSDSRLGELKDLDGYFPFTPAKTRAEWEARAERVRRQMLVSQGLWPMPTKTPANAVVHGKVERDTYTIERVYFESYPGLYVTGSLYRPKGRSGKLPGVLCPHGHWANGRFYDRGAEGVKQDVKIGAERYEVGGRYPLQARCVQLARLGCVVFHYDMLGNADSVQLPASLVHGFAKQRSQLDTPSDWGFYSTQAELRLQNIMGVQTYNSIRALDWLSSLPDVDPARIGVTGASGGGTQTFMLCALDARPAVAFPAVMVSTAMQGGCTCENACHLRVGTGNIEFAALTAPRPLGMSAANDWTKEIDTKGLPELKQHYALLGVPDRVMARSFPHFDHNYNYASRAVMYDWFNQHLNLGAKGPVVEDDFLPLSIAEMTVWDKLHPKPAGGEDFERQLLRGITADAERQIAAWKPTGAASLDSFRKQLGGAIDVLVGRSLPPADAVEFELIDQSDRGQYQQFASLLRYKPAREELPVVFLLPKFWNRRVVIWVHAEGKAGLFAADGAPLPTVRKLLSSGTAVAAADLVDQGEFLADGKPRAELRRVKNPRESLSYTLGYNHAPLAQRAHDILTLVSFCRNCQPHRADQVAVLALDGAGPWAAAALAQAGAAVDKAAIDTAGFRFAKLRSIWDVNMLPGAVKYGDLPAMLALSAPRPLWLAGEGEHAPDWVAAAYRASRATENLTLYGGSAEQKAAAAVEWLLK